MAQAPEHAIYDVVIIGGAIVGSSVAWWTMNNPDFTGRILVIERDPSYEFASTSHTNSCIRQQFGTKINIRISQFCVEFIKDFKALMHDVEAPQITLLSHGYLYLADNPDFEQILRDNQKVQAALGAGTKILSPDELAQAFPFYHLEDILAGSHNTRDEGYFDGSTVFSWLRKKARQLGVEYINNEVTGISQNRGRVTGVTLASGENIAAGLVVNASGPRASLTAQMVGLQVPIEPRKRHTFIFDAQDKVAQNMPLTIDPAGVHFRADGAYFMAGRPPDPDLAVAVDDFEDDHDMWQDRIWPVLAHRVPAFERIKVINSWVGHYAYNTLDQNAIVGPHPDLPNFIFANGFSGHGLQQSPAIGRGVSELIVHGGYQTLDLGPLGVERIIEKRPLVERAII